MLKLLLPSEFYQIDVSATTAYVAPYDLFLTLSTEVAVATCATTAKTGCEGQAQKTTTTLKTCENSKVTDKNIITEDSTNKNYEATFIYHGDFDATVALSSALVDGGACADSGTNCETSPTVATALACASFNHHNGVF